MPDRIDFAEIERRVRDDEIAALDAYKRGAGEAPILYRSNAGAVTEGVRDPDAALTFVASEESEDRAGDLIVASGWELDAFKRNSVMMWAHDYRIPPIGRWSDVRVEGKKLLGDATFDRADSFASAIEAKYRTRFLHAVSVGFRAIAFEEMETKPGEEANQRRRGYRFTKSELLEISAVPVPMHPKALRKGLTLVDDAPVWVFMPGDKTGEFAVIDLRRPRKDADGAREMLDQAIEMHGEHMADSETATPARMRKQLSLMRGARKQMDGMKAVTESTTTTSGSTIVVNLSRTDQGGDAAAATTKDAPPDHGGTGKRRIAALVAELKRVREGDN